MKKIALPLLIVVGVLQGCAGTVSPQGKSTQKLLNGSDEISYSSTKNCQRGIGMVRLYKDTLDGNKTKFNAKFALTSEAIAEEINVYSLIGETSQASKTKSKAKIDSTRNSIVIKLIPQVKDDPSARAATGEIVRCNEPISIRYNPKAGYYENWGSVSGCVLSDKDGDSIIEKISVMIGEEEKEFAVPTTIDGADPLDKKFSATIGEPKVLKLNPSDIEDMLHIQFANGKKGSSGATYNYFKKEGQSEGAIANGEVSVPTEDIAKGDYALNIFRSKVEPVPMTADGKEIFCMEVSTGAMGMISVSEPEAPAKK